MGFSWNLRKYQNGDERSIVELLNIAFGKWHSLAYWKWWYKKNPAGSPIIWLAEHNNMLIGHYGIIPIKMKVGNTYLTGSFSCDAATHPDYQGKGVFSSIVNKSRMDAAENNIPITYGIANINLGPTYKRYEWRGHICFIADMIKVLNWEPLLNRYIHNKFLSHFTARIIKKIRLSSYENKGIKTERISHFDERINKFWEESSKNFKIMVKRDQKHLNWRYVDHPENKYTFYIAVKKNRIIGYCVLLEHSRTGLIVDILSSEDHRNVISCLIQQAFEQFKEQDIDLVSCQISEKNPYKEIFKKAGFITYPRRKLALFTSINLRGFHVDEKKYYSQALQLSQNPFFKEKRNWFIMSGDGDGV